MRDRILAAALALAVAAGHSVQAAPAQPAKAPPAEGPAASSEADRLFEEGFGYFQPEDGKGRDLARAKALFERAAAMGHGPSMNALSVMYQHGAGVPQDQAKAVEWLEKAVKAGDPVAMLNLGIRLSASDRGADQSRGFGLLESARRLAPQEALRSVAAGEMAKALLFGAGTPRDIDRGVAMLLEADRGGAADEGVLFLLGRTYESGWGATAQDPRKSAGYFRRAAEAGHPASAWRLGMAYLEGAGVPRDERTAWTWVSRAAEGGDTAGQISAAVMLATGEGVAEDDAKAREWYRKAAERRSAHALRGLGGMLLSGEGGPADRLRGVAYLEMAREGGDENAGVMLKTLSPKLSPEDRRAVEAIKIDWKRRFGDPR